MSKVGPGSVISPAPTLASRSDVLPPLVRVTFNRSPIHAYYILIDTIFNDFLTPGALRSCHREGRVQCLAQGRAHRGHGLNLGPKRSAVINLCG